ncbi:hypothetical protein D9615_003236 [Tricholomella constricta]|uniref:non-specific serine/threonine protein kinase n=1 Tax=Tricholomella constricta TaxID=117010 RepID=A0A8H5M856_9AGAR|nr:hypothetical protein D9615_003236 [Tricholomella constricta]
MVAGRSAGRAVCLKIYQKTDILRDDALRRRILREVDAHKVIFAGTQKRNIETFVLRIEASLVDASRVFLATELMCRNLLQEIAENVLEKNTIRKWIAQIDLGLFVIHHRKIIHGALRPESILVGFDGNVKVTDLSASLPASSFTNRMHEKPQWPYSAPETWNRTPGTIVTKAIDYWGLGVIVVGLEAERKHTRWVFDVNYGEAFRRWYDTAYPTFPGLDDEATALVSGLLNSYPELRFGHLQLKKQRYFGTTNRDNKYAEIEQWKPKDPPYIPLESKASHPEKYLPTDKIEDHKDCDARFKPFCWINNKGVWGKAVKGHGEIMYSSR